MRTGHERIAVTERLRSDLLAFVVARQAHRPRCLMTRGSVSAVVAEGLDATRQAASRHINEAVLNGSLLIIHPRPDWMTELPGGEDLPPLFTAPYLSETSLYQLQLDRPPSRGPSNKVAFLIPAQSLPRLLTMVREQLGMPPRADDAPEVYLPQADRIVRPSMYAELIRSVVTQAPGITASRAKDVVDDLLRPLKLLPPPVE